MSDCSKNKKEVAGISDMKVLAEMVADLHYETLSSFLVYLSNKLADDANKDFKNGKLELSNQLTLASSKSYETSLCIRRAWKISKPFMEKN